MSSVQGVRSSQPSMLEVVLEDQEKRKFEPKDLNGDGVIDAKDTDGKGELLDAILASYGVRVEAGQLVSDDGLPINADNMAIATDFSGPPPAVFPEDLEGGFEDSSVLQDRFQVLIELPSVENASLLWQALLTLAQTEEQDREAWGEMVHAMQLAFSQAFKASIASAERQIESQNRAGLTNFSSTVATSATTGYVGVTGSFGDLGEALVDAKAGDVINAGVELADNTAGHGAAAADEGLRQQRMELTMEDAELFLDGAQAQEEAAADVVENALTLLVEHVERDAQIVASYT